LSTKDFGFLGRSFRVGWSIDGRIFHNGNPILQSEFIEENQDEINEGKQEEDLVSELNKSQNKKKKIFHELIIMAQSIAKNCQFQNSICTICCCLNWNIQDLKKIIFNWQNQICF